MSNVLTHPNSPAHSFPAHDDYLLQSLNALSRAAHRVAAGVDQGDLADRLEQVAADIDSARQRLANLGCVAVSVRQRDHAAVGSLSYRENQVLDLITDGLTNREIAGDLGLAEKTVKNYVSTLFVKLHVNRRTQAALYGASNRSAPPWGTAVAVPHQLPRRIA